MVTLVCLGWRVIMEGHGTHWWPVLILGGQTVHPLPRQDKDIGIRQ